MTKFDSLLASAFGIPPLLSSLSEFSSPLHVQMPCRFVKNFVSSASLLVLLGLTAAPATGQATSASTSSGTVYAAPVTESDYKRMRSEYARQRVNQVLSGKPVSAAPPPSAPIVPTIPAPSPTAASEAPAVRKAPIMQPTKNYTPSYYYLQRPQMGGYGNSAPTVQKLDTAPVAVSPIVAPSPSVTVPPPAASVVLPPQSPPVAITPPPPPAAVAPVVTAPVAVPTVIAPKPVSDNADAERELEEFLARQSAAAKNEPTAEIPSAAKAPLNTDPLAPPPPPGAVPPAPASLTPPVPVGPNVGPIPVGPNVIAPDTNVAEVPVAHVPAPIPEPVTGPLDENGIGMPDKPAEAELSKETREILTLLPESLTGMPQRKPNLDVDIERAGSDVTLPEGDVVKSESMDMDIKMQQPKMDVSYELEQAYEALLNGNTDTAVTIYREVLTTDPLNEQALFGLATTYHRMGLFEEARPVYGKLLALNPNHTEALNNFLALVGEESPEAALKIMERLAEKNPEYSPIPAQMAILCQKMEDMECSVHYMRKAYSLSPENLVYLYNLAILYDKKGDKKEAAAIYKQLLEAYERGQDLPATPSEIQERLTFLLSN